MKFETNLNNFIYLLKSLFGCLSYNIAHLFLSGKVKSQNRILFIHTSGIGDLIHSTKIVNSLESEKVNEIYFLVKGIHKEFYNSYTGRIKLLFIEYENYSLNIFYRIKFLTTLRLMGFNTVFLLNHHRRIKDDDVALNIGAEIVIALNISDKDHIKVCKNYFDNQFDEILFRDNQFIQNKYEYLLLRFFPMVKVIDSTIYLNEEKALQTLYVKYPKMFQKEYIAINPASSDEIRNWTPDNFKKIIEHILDKHSYEIILLGDKSQRNYLQSMILDKNRVHNFAGKTDLSESFIIIKKSILFIGIDSALAHLAINFNIPRILLLGGGPYGLNYPIEYYQKEIFKQKLLFKEMECFGCNWHCKFDEPHCLNDINPNDVNEIIDSMLSERVN